MKMKSKRKSGFTLLETVLTMMIIAILSVAVYNGFMLLVRNTKDGEVKQNAALIGKQVIEQIRSGDIEPDSGDIYYDKDGKEVADEMDSYYTAAIEKSEAKAKVGTKENNISISNGNNQNVYYVSDDAIIKGDNDTSKRSESEIEKTISIICGEGSYRNKKIQGIIKFDGESKEEDIDDAANIALNFKYIADGSKITVKVDNKSGKEINLVIINNMSDRDDSAPKVEIENVNGSLKKAYRADDYNTGRDGMLYKITVKVSGKDSRGIYQDKLFEGDMFKNIS